MKSVLLPREFPEVIQGKRLILKKHNLEEARPMFELVNEERGRLREFLPWVDQVLTFEDEVRFIEKSLKWWSELNAFDYSIYLKDSGAYAGNVGLHTIDWHNERIELGYFLWQPFEGNGYVGESIALLEELAFRYGFYRIEIRCDPKNIRSQDVARRAGYTEEGILRSNVIIGSQRRDTMIFAKLRGQ